MTKGRMKVAAFNGSPRVGGNIEMLLAETIRPIEDAGHEVATFRLNEMNIRPCQDCGGCEGTGRCVQADDMASISRCDPRIRPVHPCLSHFLFRSFGADKDDDRQVPGLLV